MVTRMLSAELRHLEQIQTSGSYHGQEVQQLYKVDSTHTHGLQFTEMIPKAVQEGSDGQFNSKCPLNHPNFGLTWSRL